MFATLLASPVFRALAICAVALIAVKAYVLHVENRAVHAYAQKQEAAAAKEHARRLDTLAETQRVHAADVRRLKEMHHVETLLRREIEVRRRRLRHVRCLDADSVSQLDATGHPANP